MKINPMSTSDQILALFEDRVSTYFNPVDRQEILDFTQQYGIDLREDHLDFLTKYGDATLFKTGFGEISFKDFKDYYIEEANDPGIKKGNLLQNTPLGSLYFGLDGHGFLAIEQATGRLGFYYTVSEFKQLYFNIKSFLFYSLCKIYNLFDEKTQERFSSKEEVDFYRKEHKKDRLVDIVDYDYDYYFHDHTIIALSKFPGTYYKKHVGGVLNQFEEK